MYKNFDSMAKVKENKCVFIREKTLRDKVMLCFILFFSINRCQVQDDENLTQVFITSHHRTHRRRNFLSSTLIPLSNFCSFIFPSLFSELFVQFWTFLYYSVEVQQRLSNSEIHNNDNKHVPVNECEKVLETSKEEQDNFSFKNVYTKTKQLRKAPNELLTLTT